MATTAKTEKINGIVGTLFKDGPHPIYVLPDGRFSVHWGGSWVTKSSLRSVEAVIAIAKTSLKIFAVSFGNDLRVVDAVELLERKVIDRAGKKHHGGYGDTWYIFDEQKVLALVDLRNRYEAAMDAFRKEYHRTIKGLERVSDHDFKEKLAGKRDPDDVEDYEID